MNRFFFTLIFLLGSLQLVSAQDLGSSLEIRLSDNRLIAASVDGRYFPQEAQSLTVNRLPPGQHHLRVIVTPPYGRGRKTLAFEGDVRIDPATRHYLVIDRFRHVLRMRRNPVRADRYDRDDRRLQDQPYDELSDPAGSVPDEQQDMPPGEGNYDSPDASDRSAGEMQDPGQRLDDQQAVPEGGNYDSRAEPELSANTNASDLSTGKMQDLGQRLDALITDSEKLQLLKTELTDRSLFSNQVAMVLSWLNFDSSRLEFAEWAYDRVSDKEHYRDLERTFSFESTKDELEHFLQAPK